MRSPAAPIAIACLFMAAGCNTPSMQPPKIDASGVMHYTASHVTDHVVCGDHQIVLEGDHTDLTLTGACRSVTLAGAHNDVTAELAAGAVFDITGSHNDVNWRQVSAGPHPSLLATGEGDTYHPARPKD
ncbi:MAG TPA: DUF3060 domain-containing protein [Rhodopila sp.]